MSASPEPTQSGPIPRGRRGETCYNCRRRKIKCDSEKPQCGNCARGGMTFEDCEYPVKGGPSQVALLEERIESIKHRISLLEAPESSQEVSLHQPYHSSSDSSSGDSAGDSPSPSAIPFHEMSQQEKQSHAQIFLGQAQHVGFFMTPDQIWGVILADPQATNLSPALTEAILLWSSYWSSNFGDAREYLRRAVDQLANDNDLSSARPHTVMHSIQAEVLVSYYLFAAGKTLEGVHHASSALSLTLASGLHRIGSPGAKVSSTYLPPYTSFKERDERINAFWSVIGLITHWATVKHSDLLLAGLEFDSVTTPWPVDPEFQGTGEYPSEATLDSFLRGFSASGYSVSALHVKAGILLERAISYHANSSVSAASSGQFAHLDNLIEGFKQALPGVDAGFTNSVISDKGLVTHLLVSAATIRLHLPYVTTVEVSKRKCIFAAHTIAHITNVYMGNDIDWQFLDPIIGAVWMSAAEVLMPHVISGSLNNDEHSAAVTSLETVFSQWNKLAERVDMFSLLMTRFEKECASAFRSFT